MSNEFEYGKKSDANKRLQQALIRIGYLPEGSDDGIFGRGTNQGLKTFKRYHALSTTLDDQWERVDERTRNMLFPKEAKEPIMGNLLGGLLHGFLGNLLNWELIKGYLRNVLMWAAGAVGLDALVGHDGTVTIVAAVLTVAGVIVSALSNNTKVKAMEVVKAVDAAPNVALIPADVSPTGKPIVKATP